MSILPAIADFRSLVGSGALTAFLREHQQQLAAIQQMVEMPAAQRAFEQANAFTETFRRAEEQIQILSGSGAAKVPQELSAGFAGSQGVVEMTPFVQEFAENTRRLREQMSVPDSKLMDRMVGSHAVADIARAMRDFEEPARRLREQMSALTAPFERLRDLVGHLQPSWLISAHEIAERVRWAHVDRRVAQLLFRRGWLGVERHLEDETLSRLLEIRGRNKGAAVDRAICTAFRRNRFALMRRMVKRWKNVPYLRKHSFVTRDAFAAHRERRYSLSIPALLPLVDGLAADIRTAHPHLVRPKGKKGGTPSMKEVVSDIAKLYDTNGRSKDYADAVLAALAEKVFERYDFEKDPAPSALNRHGILHGRIANYPSAVNSLRAFLVVDVMAHIAEELERKKP